MTDSSVHPRMVALEAQIAGERQQVESHFAHRVAALNATLREEEHATTAEHRFAAGEDGKCAVCDAVVHHVGAGEHTV